MASRKRNPRALLFFRLSMLLALLLAAIFLGDISDAVAKWVTPKFLEAGQPSPDPGGGKLPVKAEPEKVAAPEKPTVWDPSKESLPPGMSREK
jgi:hypothetical protein